MFLELFEDEYNEMHREKLNVQRLLSDSTLLLPPAHSPMTGIPLSKRLPCGDVGISFFYSIKYIISFLK